MDEDSEIVEIAKVSSSNEDIRKALRKKLTSCLTLLNSVESGCSLPDHAFVRLL